MRCTRALIPHTQVENPLANAQEVRDAGLIPGLRRSPGGRHGNLLQYSCLESPMDRGACWATVRWVARGWTQLSGSACSMHPLLTQMLLLLLLLLLLLSRFSHVRLCATPEMAAHQAPRPWDSPGKNTGVGCHCLFQCMKVKVKVKSLSRV